MVEMVRMAPAPILGVEGEMALGAVVRMVAMADSRERVVV